MFIEKISNIRQLFDPEWGRMILGGYVLL